MSSTDSTSSLDNCVEQTRQKQFEFLQELGIVLWVTVAEMERAETSKNKTKTESVAACPSDLSRSFRSVVLDGGLFCLSFSYSAHRLTQQGQVVVLLLGRSLRNLLTFLV